MWKRKGFVVGRTDKVGICIYERMTLAFWRHKVARKTCPSGRERVLQKREGGRRERLSIENNNNVGVRCALAAKPYGGGKRVDG